MRSEQNPEWIRITNDWHVYFSEDPKKIKSPNTLYWIKQHWNGRTHTTSADNTYELYDYTIYNSKLEECILSKDGYIIKKISDRYANIYQRNTDFIFIDCAGNTKVENFISSGSCKAQNIKEAFEFLNPYSSFDTWREYELSLKVKKLNEEIKELKNCE